VPIEEDPQPLPVGAWEVLRPGGDLAILEVGACVAPALAAAEALAAEGLRIGVVNARFVKPLDAAVLAATAAANPLLLTARGGARGRVGAAVLEQLSAHGPVGVRVGGRIPDEFAERPSRPCARPCTGLEGTDRSPCGQLRRKERAVAAHERVASVWMKTSGRLGLVLIEGAGSRWP
jgi:deoxyxylulose-5-phosphate synthase